MSMRGVSHVWVYIECTYNHLILCEVYIMNLDLMKNKFS